MLSRQDGHHSAVALLLKAALIQVSDYRLLGASGFFKTFNFTTQYHSLIHIWGLIAIYIWKTFWKKWFYIWYVALAWWFVPCLPFPGLPHIYFLFTVRLRIFHVCSNENFHNRYLSFYWKKWFYIWYVALAWWLVPCLLFPGLPHIYFLFTVRLTNERVGVFLVRRSVQHLVKKSLELRTVNPLHY